MAVCTSFAAIENVANSAPTRAGTYRESFIMNERVYRDKSHTYYLLHIVSNDQEFTHWRPSEDKLRESSAIAQHFAGLANQFVHDQYRASFPDIEPSFFNKMQSENIMLDGRSDLFVIMRGPKDGSSMSEVAGVARVAKRTEYNRELPGEIMFSKRVTEPTRPKGREQEFIDWYKSYKGRYVPPHPEVVEIEFRTNEIKNIAAAERGRDSVMSILSDAMNRSIGEWDRFERFDGSTGPNRLIFWDRVALFCSKMLIPYYERFGLKTFGTTKGNSVQMVGDAPRFLESWQEQQSPRSSVNRTKFEVEKKIPVFERVRFEDWMRQRVSECDFLSQTKLLKR